MEIHTWNAITSVSNVKTILKLLEQRVINVYPIQFQKEGQLEKVRALIDSGSKVNAMTPAFVARLGLITRVTNVGAKKIDGSPLETYGMASAEFLLQDNLEKVRFFEETFLLADTSVEVVLRMPFLSLGNADFQFGAEKIYLEVVHHCKGPTHY